MKVLHLSGARSWGGNEQQLVLLISELKSLGVKNVVFGVPNSLLEKYCLQHQISFIPCKSDKLNRRVNYKYLKQIINTNKPEVLHLHTSDSVTVFYLSDLFYRLKIPVVFSKKGVSRKTSFLSRIKYNYKNIDRIICVSETVKNHFKSVLKPVNHPKLVVVYDAVKKPVYKQTLDLKKTYNISPDKFLIGNIANHTVAKDLFTFINVANFLINGLKFTNVHFIQIGDFSHRTEQYKMLVKEYQLEEYITFTGFLHDASCYLPQCKLFLLTSEREGGPTSVIEAFSFKTPVVSTQVGVVNEMIENGINGFICPIKDYKELAKKCKILILDDELQKDFAVRSYRKYESFFTSKKLASDTLTIYNNLIH